MENQRVGIIGIIITDRKRSAPSVNEVLSEFGDIIVGRIGMPYKKRGFHIISLIVDGSMDEIGALTGRLGMIQDVRVKSAMA